MHRQARIDAPGAVHHIIARGIERGEIFHDDQDRTLRVLSGSAREIINWSFSDNQILNSQFKVSFTIHN